MSPEPPTASHHPWLRVPLADYEGHMRAPGVLARDFRLIEETYRAVPGGKGLSLSIFRRAAEPSPPR